MADQPDVPTVDVAVALIRRGEQVLTIFNPRWSSFTLPMTKRRDWQDPRIPPAHRKEGWVDAAARAAGECFGRTFTTDPEFVADLPDWKQGDREGVWKRYNFQVFRISLSEDDGDSPCPGAIVEWLTPDEILDQQRRPISPSARHIIGKLKEEGHLD